MLAGGGQNLASSRQQKVALQHQVMNLDRVIHSSFHVEDLLTRPWSDPIGQKLASHLHLLSSMVLALSLWETFKTVFPEGF